MLGAGGRITHLTDSTPGPMAIRTNLVAFAENTATELRMNIAPTGRVMGILTLRDVSAVISGAPVFCKALTT